VEAREEGRGSGLKGTQLRMFTFPVAGRFLCAQNQEAGAWVRPRRPRVEWKRRGQDEGYSEKAGTFYQ
jgi:hypothetical protein